MHQTINMFPTADQIKIIYSTADVLKWHALLNSVGMPVIFSEKVRFCALLEFVLYIKIVLNQLHWSACVSKQLITNIWLTYCLTQMFHEYLPESHRLLQLVCDYRNWPGLCLPHNVSRFLVNRVKHVLEFPFYFMNKI